MIESKTVSIRVTRNKVTTFIKDCKINYWVERSWSGHTKTYYEFKELLLPGWAKHLKDDLEDWLSTNLEAVDGLWYGDVLEINI